MHLTVLEKTRRDAGLTKAALARKAGVQPNVVTWAESGRFHPYPVQLEKLADALGITDPSTLLDRLEVEASD